MNGLRMVVPVMFSLAEQDTFFESTAGHVRSFAQAFCKSKLVDSSFVNHAPHCMELSYWSQGWYSRCFGFAIECSVGNEYGSDQP